jgi:hypothetical protein
MPLKNVDMGFWRRDEKIQSVATRGFNHLVEIPRLLKEVHPEFKEWEFGFCNAEQLPLWRAEKWIHMQPHHFPEVGDFNREIASRFRLHDKNGVLCYKHLYLMMMPKDYRLAVLKDRQEASKAEFRSSVRTGKTRAADGSEVETTLEQKKVTMPGKQKS